VCVVPMCGRRATRVDHIKSRRAGGLDVLANLRSLCMAHDNQVKEDKDGNRRSGGRLTVRTVGVDGWPT
jgi:5-methylcytosine-specific restriction endonuclease McrA